MSFLLFANTQSISFGLGSGQTNVVSTQYKAKSTSSAEVEARFSYGLTNQWSILGQYQGATDSSISSFILGASFDTSPLRTHSGSFNHEGVPEIEKVPKWLFRFSVGLGTFQFSNSLESSDKNLGTKNEVVVEATLYGFAFDAGVYRFFNSELAAYAKLTEAIASAGNFGINRTNIIFGVFWLQN